MTEAPTIAEQYLRAINTKNLQLKPTPCQADKLLAAGYAVMGDPQRNLALSLWRMREMSDSSGFESMVDVLYAWAHNRLTRRNKRVGKMTRQTIRRTLWLWLHPTCHVCNGLGHPIIEGTPVIDDTRDCPECHGTGKGDIRKLVAESQKPLALDTMDELDRLSAIVFSDMARILNKDLQSLVETA
jgi:hypothetical protein